MSNLSTALSSDPWQPLCDAKGKLLTHAVGWSSRPHLNCALPGHYGRRKRWNHWCITSPDWMLALTVADLDYIGYGAAYFLDLQTGHAVAHTQLRPLARGCALPDTPLQGHRFGHSRLHISLDEHPGRARLIATVPDIGGQTLQVALDVQRPSHLDSVNLVVPFPQGGFHATSRHMGLPVSGDVQLGTTQYRCTRGNSFAALDFGRGVWPLSTHWTRAAFAAPGGIAGNFGSGWTDNTGLSENALWFGGELVHVPNPVTITGNPHNPSAPWQLNSEDDRLALVFTPRQQHVARPKAGPFYAETRQWFGQFDGVLRGPKGERVPVDGALGWLGTTNARW